MIVLIRKSKEVDLPKDLMEIDARILNRTIRMSSMVYEGRVNDEVVCLWGLIPPTLMSNQAYLWLHTTDLVKEHQFIFVRYSQLAVEEMLRDYDVLVGHCHAKARDSIRWVKWLGATFGEPEGMKVPFTIRKREWIR